MYPKRRRKKKTRFRPEVLPSVWLPEAYHFGSLFSANGIRYAIFGAGALAAHGVMVRPTIDVDFVVDNYKNAVESLKKQSNIDSMNLEEDKDGIQVADFHYKSGVTVQVWDNNLYSLPMTENSWSRITMRNVPGYGLVNTICMEDLIVSKVGRYTQQKSDSRYEADKNVKDIIAAIDVLSKPDLDYVILRLKEGARRETTSKSSKIHPLTWYFVREVQVYNKVAASLNRERVRRFTASILATSNDSTIEYWLLHNLRRRGNVRAFQSDFFLDEGSLAILIKRWSSLVRSEGDKLDLSAKNIQDYLRTLEPAAVSEYAKRLAFAGKG